MLRDSAGSMIAAALLLFTLVPVDAVGRGLRSVGPSRGRRLSSGEFHDAYFSEILSAGDSVVVFEDGPVKFTASCKTVTHDYSYYGYSFTSSSWNGTYSGSSSSSGGSSSYTQTHSSSYYHPLTSTSSSCYDPCKSSSSTEDYSYSFEPDASSGSSSTMMYEPTSSPEDPAEGTVTTMSDGPSVPYDDDAGSSSGDMPAEPADEGEYSTPSPTMSFDPYDYSYTESFAALELTYTASDADYLYGSPTYGYYPDEDILVGAYEPGETRTQTVFAGRDGGYGDEATLQSTSGYYMSINGDSTIGIHKDWAGYYGMSSGADAESFPEGVDCMIAGFITFVVPTEK